MYRKCLLVGATLFVLGLPTGTAFAASPLTGATAPVGKGTQTGPPARLPATARQVTAVPTLTRHGPPTTPHERNRGGPRYGWGGNDTTPPTATAAATTSVSQGDRDNESDEDDQSGSNENGGTNAPTAGNTAATGAWGNDDQATSHDAADDAEANQATSHDTADDAKANQATSHDTADDAEADQATSHDTADDAKGDRGTQDTTSDVADINPSNPRDQRGQDTARGTDTPAPDVNADKRGARKCKPECLPKQDDCAHRWCKPDHGDDCAHHWCKPDHEDDCAHHWCKPDHEDDCTHHWCKPDHEDDCTHHWCKPNHDCTHHWCKPVGNWCTAPSRQCDPKPHHGKPPPEDEPDPADGDGIPDRTSTGPPTPPPVAAVETYQWTATISTGSANAGGKHTAAPKPTSDPIPLATITPVTPVAAATRVLAVASGRHPGILGTALFAAGTSLLLTLLALTAGHLATRPKRG